MKFNIGLPWAAVGLAMLSWLMSTAYGFQYAVSDNHRALYFRLLTIPFAAIVAGITWHALRNARGQLSFGLATKTIALLMMTVSWMGTCYFYSAHITLPQWWLVAVLVPALALAGYYRWGQNGANLIFLTSLVLLSTYLIGRIPNHAGADMLQIIELASRDFLSGENPFRTYLTSSQKQVPFGYWPGIWLPYVPFVAFGIDIRILNLLALILLMLLFNKAAGQDANTPFVLALTLYPFLLSSSVMQHLLLGHLWAYWLAASATMILLVNGKHTPASIAFGLCLASRPTALFIAAPLTAFVWSKYGLKQTLKSIVIAIIIVAGLNMPFAVSYGSDFWNNSYSRLIGFGQELVHFSLAGFLRDHGFGLLAKPIQILLLLLAMLIIVVRQNFPTDKFIMFAGATYIWMMLFNSYAIRYMYFTGFILVALGLCIHYSRICNNDGSVVTAGSNQQ